MEFWAEMFTIEEDPDLNPVTFSELHNAQKSDVLLQKLLALQPCSLTQKIFHGGGIPYNLWTFKEKIYVPLKMQKK